jgi:hypothetical protein
MYKFSWAPICGLWDVIIGSLGLKIPWQLMSFEIGYDECGLHVGLGFAEITFSHMDSD